MTAAQIQELYKDMGGKLKFDTSVVFYQLLLAFFLNAPPPSFVTSFFSVS